MRTAPRPEPAGAAVGDNPPCPVCAGKMWDNRESKKNPKAPDFKCRDKKCDGVIWPPRNSAPQAAHGPAFDDIPEALLENDEAGLPF